MAEISACTRKNLAIEDHNLRVSAAAYVAFFDPRLSLDRRGLTGINCGGHVPHSDGPARKLFSRSAARRSDFAPAEWRDRFGRNYFRRWLSRLLRAGISHSSGEGLPFYGPAGHQVYG